MKRAAALCLVLIVAACDDADQGKPASSVDAANRQAAAASAATATAARLHLPAAVVKAEQVEWRRGDGVLGPSDVSTFTILELPKDRLATWRPETEPLAAAPAYQAPEGMTRWVSRKDFATLEFFSSSPLLFRSGWIAVSRADGRLYIFTTTS